MIVQPQVRARDEFIGACEVYQPNNVLLDALERVAREVEARFVVERKQLEAFLESR